LAKSVGLPTEEHANRYVHVDDHLARILSSLAHLLLRHGYGHARLARLAKIAFVDAARSIGTKLNAKANIARIAALTGLTRVEVSRILKSDRSLRLRDDQLNRTSRVAAGWLTDKSYLDRNSRPRALPFSGSRIGFVNLVKKYSGDIPARAMLSEMLRLGLVARSSSGMISLIRNTPELPSSAVSTIGAISPWVSFVADAGNSLASRDMASQTQQVRIHFNSISETIAAARELDIRRRSFVAGIQELGTKNKSSGDFDLTVSVAVATTKPTRSVRKKK
jgi:hypothetical protein